MRTCSVLLVSALHARIGELRRNPDAGYTTETVLVTALLLVVAALVVVGIIVAKVTAKANGIDLGL
ncbi:MAG: hypothetical protein DLM61_11625 [Pseudonocardiales bacterium]|nr:MAG: hypothetical protein DLM61_11625 [Pseudonocardiales bacterium]